ncbi:hypothetical protein GF336_05840 [Candidatus Woesearchaeota archaeon]|nr:hypothetical protein [Candidatus Woesearchaeota archaeon]
MIAHSINITVFAKEGEDKERIISALKEFIPFDIEKEKIEFNQKKTLGFDDKKITVLEILLEKEKHIKGLLDNLKEKLSEEAKYLILKQKESRLDQELNFFLRFSKQRWIEKKELWLTDKGKCFHIKIKLAVFPKKREKAIKKIEKMFS